MVFNKLDHTKNNIKRLILERGWIEGKANLWSEPRAVQYLHHYLSSTDLSPTQMLDILAEQILDIRFIIPA